MSDEHLKAFALKEAYSEFSGGTVGYGADRRTFDVGEALNEGDGVIVVDLNEEPQLYEALRGFEPLKNVSVPGGAHHTPDDQDDSPSSLGGPVPGDQDDDEPDDDEGGDV